jgi:hypothetical protein
MFEKLRSTQPPDEAPAEEAAPSVVREVPANDTPVGRLRPSLASLLADEGVASKEQLEHAAAEGLESGERLGEVVLRRGWITEAGLANLIARQWELTFVARSLISVDADAQARMSREVAQHIGVCPVTSNDGAPLVAIADPSEERFTGARDALGDQCTFVVTTPSALAQLIDELPCAPALVSLAEAPAPAAPVLSVADPDVEPEHVTESLAGPEVEVRPEPSPVSVASPAPAPLALTTDEPADDGSPVLDQLDKLLDRLVSERVSTADELAGHRRQLDELADEKARLEKSLRSVEDKVRSTGETIQSLEAQLAREDELLESMRTKLAGLTRSADRA